DKTFFVNLSTPDSYAAVSNGVGVGTLVDSSPRISIYDSIYGYDSIYDIRNYDATTFTFTVSLSAAYDEAVTVNFGTADGAALAGVDYVAVSGTLTFAPGETTKTITVDVLNPNAADLSYFTVRLSGATTNALIATESAYGYWFYDVGVPGWDGYVL